MVKTPDFTKIFISKRTDKNVAKNSTDIKIVHKNIAQKETGP